MSGKPAPEREGQGSLERQGFQSLKIQYWRTPYRLKRKNRKSQNRNQHLNGKIPFRLESFCGQLRACFRGA